MHPSIFRKGALYFQYKKVTETYGDISGNLSRKYLSEKFSSSKWLYSKNLVGHTGCVNALAFSKNGGEFLVSGTVYGIFAYLLYFFVQSQRLLHTTWACDLKPNHPCMQDIWTQQGIWPRNMVLVSTLAWIMAIKGDFCAYMYIGS